MRNRQTAATSNIIAFAHALFMQRECSGFGFLTLSQDFFGALSNFSGLGMDVFLMRSKLIIWGILSV